MNKIIDFPQSEGMIRNHIKRLKQQGKFPYAKPTQDLINELDDNWYTLDEDGNTIRVDKYRSIGEKVKR